MSIRSRRRLLLPSIIALALTICGLVILQACETPVYRYAMYRWNPAPYEIYYFHNEPLGSETQAFHARIKELVKTRPDHPILNATLIPVDLSKDPELKQVLPDIKQLWTKHQKELSPGYLVTNPQGGVISIGTLAEQQLSTFSDSAQRRQLLAQLAQGKAAVMVLLSGQDPAAMHHDTRVGLLDHRQRHLISQVVRSRQGAAALQVDQRVGESDIVLPDELVIAKDIFFELGPVLGKVIRGAGPGSQGDIQEIRGAGHHSAA